MGARAVPAPLCGESTLPGEVLLLLCCRCSCFHLCCCLQRLRLPPVLPRTAAALQPPLPVCALGEMTETTALAHRFTAAAPPQTNAALAASSGTGKCRQSCSRWCVAPGTPDACADDVECHGRLIGPRVDEPINSAHPEGHGRRHLPPGPPGVPERHARTAVPPGYSSATCTSPWCRGGSGGLRWRWRRGR